MNYAGILIGLFSFLIIGIFHPLVIYGEYHFGVKCWWLFALFGGIFTVATLFTESIVASALLGVTGFSCFWSIHELFQQRKRVEKGWFPSKSSKK